MGESSEQDASRVVMSWRTSSQCFASSSESCIAVRKCPLDAAFSSSWQRNPRRMKPTFLEDPLMSCAMSLTGLSSSGAPGSACCWKKREMAAMTEAEWERVSCRSCSLMAGSPIDTSSSLPSRTGCSSDCCASSAAVALGTGGEAQGTSEEEKSWGRGGDEGWRGGVGEGSGRDGVDEGGEGSGRDDARERGREEGRAVESWVLA